MIDDTNEKVWVAVRRRLDAVTRDVAVPARLGFAGDAQVNLGPRPAVTSRDPATLRRLAAVALAVLLIGVIGNQLLPAGGRTGGSGSSAETSSAAPATTDDSRAPATTATSVDLPTHSTPVEDGLCPAAHLGPVILRADRSRTQPVYVESATRRLTVLWPYGFTARFGPLLEILDDRDELVAREGDMLDLMGGVTDERFDFFACHVTRVDP